MDTRGEHAQSTRLPRQYRAKPTCAPYVGRAWIENIPRFHRAPKKPLLSMLSPRRSRPFAQIVSVSLPRRLNNAQRINPKVSDPQSSAGDCSILKRLGQVRKPYLLQKQVQGRFGCPERLVETPAVAQCCILGNLILTFAQLQVAILICGHSKV